MRMPAIEMRESASIVQAGKHLFARFAPMYYMDPYRACDDRLKAAEALVLASKGIAQGAAGPGAGGLPIRQDRRAVDDDFADALGQTARILVCRRGAQGIQVEDGQVGFEAGPDQAAVEAADAPRRR